MRKIDVAFIIDDDRIYTTGIKKRLEISEFCRRILIFPDGEEAINALKTMINKEDSLPDVILLDINMPVMDGWQFLDEFAKIRPSIKKKVLVYLVSSSDSLEDMEKAKNYKDIADYIIKPIKLEDLAKIMTAHL